MMFFWTKMRVSLWLGVCIYTYGYIYQRWWWWWYLGALSFLKCCLPCFYFFVVLFWKGNNTFDGKIIVTWLKIARLCGCWAYQGHNIYDVKEPAAGLVYKSEMIFFFFLFKKKKKKSADFFGPSCVSVLASFQARGNSWFFHEWCRCSIMFDFLFCLYSFYF